MAKQLLLIDDDEAISKLIADVGKNCGFTVTTTNTGNEFLKKIASSQYDLVIVDLQLSEPDIDGIELLRYLGKLKYKGPVILISAFGQKILSTAMRLGYSHGLNMDKTLSKPFSIPELTELLTTIELPYKPPSISSLADALSNESFVLHYQPKISVKDKQLIGVEVLVRYQQQNSRLIYPDEFIELAESSDLIKPITWHIIDKALQQLSTWQQRNLHFGLAINLSVKVLDDLALPDNLVELIKKYKLNPHKITFEITESIIAKKIKIVMDILVRLRLKGFNLSIDDFGTGYSSLVELYHMPFNEIKIDKSFSRNMDKDNEAKIITKAIIDLGHNLGLMTVAEGIETLAAWKLLEEFGCDIAQGYYISPPLSVQELEQWILTIPAEAVRKLPK